MVALILLPMLLSGSPWPDSVVTIDLRFDPEHWAYACAHPDLEILVDAEIAIGDRSSDCTMQIRGQTGSFHPKKSIKVRILGGGEFFGFDELNLNAQYSDRSRIRENLSYLFHASCGQITPVTAMTRVLFNGVPQGPYLFVEDVDGDFALRSWLPDDAVIYKCREYGASLASPYRLDLYRKKTFEDRPPDDLEWFIRWLGTAPDSVFLADISRWVHLNELLTCVAVNTLIGHGSTYYHNYHMVLDAPGLFGRWRMIPWDMDKTWGSGYRPDLPYYWVTNNLSVPNTLMWRLWCIPHTRGLLLDRLTDLSPGFVSWAASGVVDSLEALVEPLVQEDPFRDYSMEEFHQSVMIVRDWPAERLRYLEQMYDLWPLPFRLYPTAAQGDGSVVAHWSPAERSLGYRVALSTDSTFLDQSAVFWESQTSDTFMVLPENRAPSMGKTFLQVRAFNQYREERALNRSVPAAPAPSLPGSGDIVINEVFYRNGDYIRPGDWIELVNAGDEPVNLAGWSIRDTQDRNLLVLGDETVPAGGFLVIIGDPEAFGRFYPACPTLCKPLYFGLSAEGETLRLYDALGNMADYVPYKPVRPWPIEPAEGGWSLSLVSPERDNSLPSSWRATPNGGTPGLSNDEPPLWTPRTIFSMGGVTPNPAFDRITVRLFAPPGGPCVLRIFDLAGRVAAGPEEIAIGPAAQDFSMDIGGLPPGLYFVHAAYAGLQRSSAFVRLAGAP